MEAFEKFVKQYDQENKKIILKYNHSYRVKNVAEYLAKELNLKEETLTKYNLLTRAIKENPLNEDKIRPIWEKTYVTSDGVYQSGLHKRRVQECNMFFGKEFEIRPISLITSAGNINGKVTDNNGDGWLPTEV